MYNRCLNIQCWGLGHRDIRYSKHSIPELPRQASPKTQTGNTEILVLIFEGPGRGLQNNWPFQHLDDPPLGYVFQIAVDVVWDGSLGRRFRWTPLWYYWIMPYQCCDYYPLESHKCNVIFLLSSPSRPLLWWRTKQSTLYQWMPSIWSKYGGNDRVTSRDMWASRQLSDEIDEIG